MGVTMFVGALPYSATSQSLARLLWDQVIPERMQVVMDRESGRSAGFGFLVVSTPEDAVLAFRAAREEFDGRRVVMSVARERRPTLPFSVRTEHQSGRQAEVEMSADSFRSELLSGLTVSEVEVSWIEASIQQLGLSGFSNAGRSSSYQLLLLIDELAARPASMPDLHPRLFEYVVGALFAASGYRDVRLTGPSADGGVDIRATKNVGGGRSSFIVQCKRYAPARKIGRPTVQLLYGVSAQQRATKAALVTTSTFSRPAADFLAANENQVSGLDGEDLRIWVQATAQIAQRPERSERSIPAVLPPQRS